MPLKKRKVKGKVGKVGRPTRRTSEISDRIVERVRSGSSLELAASQEGVSESTLHRWKRESETFSHAIWTAIEERTAERVKRIDDAGRIPEQWRANAWLLEREQPKRYGLRVRVYVAEELNDFLEGLEASLPPDIYEQVLDAAARRTGGPEAGWSPDGPSGEDSRPGGESVQHPPAKP